MRFELSLRVARIWRGEPGFPGAGKHETGRELGKHTAHGWVRQEDLTLDRVRKGKYEKVGLDGGGRHSPRRGVHTC